MVGNNLSDTCPVEVAPIDMRSGASGQTTSFVNEKSPSTVGVVLSEFHKKSDG